MLLTAAAITYYSSRHLKKKPREDLTWRERVLVDSTDRILETPPVKHAIRCVYQQGSFDEEHTENYDANTTNNNEGKQLKDDDFASRADSGHFTEMTAEETVTIATNPSNLSDFGDASTNSSNFFTQHSLVTSPQHLANRLSDSDVDNVNNVNTGNESGRIDVDEQTAFREHVKREWIAAVFGPNYPNGPCEARLDNVRGYPATDAAASIATGTGTGTRTGTGTGTGTNTSDAVSSVYDGIDDASDSGNYGSDGTASSTHLHHANDEQSSQPYTPRQQSQRSIAPASPSTPAPAQQRPDSVERGIGLARISTYKSYGVTVPPVQNGSDKLGITLSRLSLGVYVRGVVPNSEAWCAGVQIDSVLVSINGMSLLAESSRQALERLWQYEGIFASTSDDKKSATVIQKPICMTFIRQGNMHKVTFLCHPPYGIEWAPCGAFALIKRSQGSSSAAGVQRGSLVAAINGKTFFKDNLDHVVCATELRNARGDTANPIRLQLCLPPPEARSGHFERQQDKKTSPKKSANASVTGRAATNRRGRPSVAASHDGVEVRFHSFFGKSRPTKPASPKKHDTVAILASRIAAGELVAINPKNVHTQDCREFRPCPPNETFLVDWSPLQCLQYCARYFHARFDEQHLGHISASHGTQCTQHSLRRLMRADPHRAAELVDTFLLQFLCCCQDERDGPPIPTRIGGGNTLEDMKCDVLVRSTGRLLPTSQSVASKPITSALLSIAKHDLRLARRIELVASSFTDLQYLTQQVAHLLRTKTSKSPTMTRQPDSGVASDAGLSQDMSIARSVTSILNTRSDGASQIDDSSAMDVQTTDDKDETADINQESMSSPKKSNKPPTHGGKSTKPDTAPVTLPKPTTRRRFFKFLRNKKKKGSKQRKAHKSGDPSTVSTVASITTMETSSTKPETHALPLPSTQASGEHQQQVETSAPTQAIVRTPPRRARPSMTRIPSMVATPAMISGPSSHELYTNMKSFLREMDAICMDLEGSLFPSISQKLTEWALQPWSAKKGTALAQLTQELRKRLSKLDKMLPMYSPMPSAELLSGLNTQECYILPSAHVPMLLTFDCNEQIQDGTDQGSSYNEAASPSTRNNNISSKIFGSEKLYRTKVELVSLRRSNSQTMQQPQQQPQQPTDASATNDSDLSSFVCHGAVSGAVVKSGRSVSTGMSSVFRHGWDDKNVLTFDTRSSWGPPQTLALRVSECKPSNATGGKVNDLSISLESSTRGLGLGHSPINNQNPNRKQGANEVGFAWVDMGPIWKQAEVNGEASQPSDAISTVSCFAQLWPADHINGFDDQGEIADAHETGAQILELEMRITTEAISPRGESRCRKRSLLYKHNDDLRQEFFAIQLLESCNNILLECGLDLKLLTFGCIPVGIKRGFIEWVPGSVPLSEICQTFSVSLLGLQKKKVHEEAQRMSDSSSMEDTRSSVARAGLTKYESLQRIGSSSGGSSRSTSSTNPIQDFLRSEAYSPHDPYMIRRSVMDTYVRSCAGYTVITYILGVGDRHLDNLLLHKTGHFFHCDYSFMLGSDPKKYLPMRITEDMVKAMGGRDSDNFAMFLSLACAAFLSLRRPANVRHLLSMIRSLETASLDDVSLNQSTETAVLGVRERLQLGLTPEEAISHIERLVDESLSSKMWMAVDAIHSLGKRF